MGFTTPSYGLTDLFARIDRGDLQLPDFQRAYAWDVDRIRALVVSVLRGYPVGSLLALDTRGEPMRFRPRPIAGAPDTGHDPGLLLLDGQQRLTTLYHCLRGDGYVDTVDFRSKRIRRTFWVDIARAVEAPVMPDEAVFAVDENGGLRSHFGPSLPGGLADREDALAAGCVPVSALLGEEATDLLFDLAALDDGRRRDDVKAFYDRIVRPLSAYDIPMIRLGRETAQAGIGSIFAQANSAGLQMDVFELLTAVFASEDPDFRLSDDWAGTERHLRDYPALDDIGRTEFLTAVSLLVTGRRGHAAGQREDILNLSLGEYRAATRELRITFREAAEFLSQRCILSTAQVPYTAQLIPLAVILALLTDTPRALASSRGWDRLNQWFWCGVLGELYGSAAVIHRAARDVDQVTAWIRGEVGEVPQSVADATFAESRFFSVREDSGAHQGIYALLMGRGARDWRTAQPFDRWTFGDLNPGFHHIFPLEWCRERGVDPVLADSVLNRTPMGKRTEVVLEGYSPSRYLIRVQSKSLMEDSEFDTVLATHELDPELLREGDVDAFLADRRARLVRVVEHAMGKPVIRDVDDANLAGGDEGPDAFER
ncbi:GmrSD restriction endonuclease domain-containing protein [Corynebacterium halotolerans]|uniref:GmrSD restriction endonucleases N-terminal domain-containing protein n=1 Tax=Corynebacterium halotolerans YIM 70093 = DSM 44683 TaxID=1121362 RepID=M1NLM2_9CORY|nr:DUF262 domain-containing protein [Corynebacterium halotolerans]AGF72303.1 hypothetical protein A605_06485 [Corynebacterium halotolerans YIM 70093 = DSM 44683]